jgi:alginate O-acetyltransferase complex protein AlgI
VLFSSPVFFVFFAAYFALHAGIPPRHRIWLIIFGGLVFYSYWYPGYFWVPPLLLAIAFGGAIWVDGAKEKSARRTRLVGAIALLLLPLLVFKYTNFIYRDVLGLLFATGDHVFQLPLPLGISFVTFTLIAYVVDVYRGAFAVERRLPLLAGHVIFFPHLIAGPILRPHELIPQLERQRPWRSAQFLGGVAVFTFGLAKKLIVADPIANAIDPVFANPAALHQGQALLAVYGFSVQIYCDFSGYTDMAIGLAAVLGVRLPNNFARPYGAASIIDFWRRWHITLSHWLRDYLYIPLGGNRQGFGRQIAAVVVTMVLGGLWHGANWTFAIWGAIHGAAVAVNHTVRTFLPWFRMPYWLGLIVTFHFVTLVWVYFRSPNVATAHAILKALVVPAPDLTIAFLKANAFAVAMILLALALHRLDDHRRIRIAIRRLPAMIAGAVLMALWVLAIAISAGNSGSFIYFDF